MLFCCRNVTFFFVSLEKSGVTFRLKLVSISVNIDCDIIRSTLKWATRRIRSTIASYLKRWIVVSMHTYLQQDTEHCQFFDRLKSIEWVQLKYFTVIAPAGCRFGCSFRSTSDPSESPHLMPPPNCYRYHPPPLNCRLERTFSACTSPYFDPSFPANWSTASKNKPFLCGIFRIKINYYEVLLSVQYNHQINHNCGTDGNIYVLHVVHIPCIRHITSFLYFWVWV